MNQINFKKEGKGSPILLLHGWGCDLTTFKKLSSELSKKYCVFSLDLNGFGKTPEPNSDWDIFEYSNAVEKFIADHEIVNPIIIGHSFGGRISILISNRLKLKKLILTGCAGIKPKRKITYYIKIYAFKLLKRALSLPILKAYNKEILSVYSSNYASEDYNSASPRMKRILSKVVNQDLTQYLKKIKTDTLLIWGEKDTATPLKDGQKMNGLIANSELKIFNECGHYAFLQEPEKFFLEVNNFINK